MIHVGLLLIVVFWWVPIPKIITCKQHLGLDQRALYFTLPEGDSRFGTGGPCSPIRHAFARSPNEVHKMEP